MEHRRARLLSTAGILSLGLLAACGTSNNTTGGGGATGALCPNGGTVTVASDLPTSGGDAAIGGGTEKGVHLAITQAQANHFLGNCTINYIPKDDASVAKGKHDPQLGAQNITGLAANQAVVGVVGPFNSGVAVAELPISNAAGLLQISPANTDPGLTIPGSDPDIDTKSLQPSGKITYYRIIANDIFQAQAGVKYFTSTLHLSKIFLMDDQETYGKDLANYVEQDTTKAGATIVKRVSLPGDTKDFRAALTQAKSLNPDGLYFAGLGSTGAGIVKRQMADIGLNIPFLGGDGDVDPQYFVDAGAAGNGNFYCTSAPDTINLNPNEKAKKFLSDFDAAYGHQALVAYSTFGFDAMNIVLTAVKGVLQDNGGNPPSDPKAFRASVIAKVASIKYDGTIGHTEFDNRGDPTYRPFSIYIAQNNTFVAKETLAVS